MDLPARGSTQQPTGLGHWVREFVVPQSSPAWLTVRVDTPQVRFPIFVPVPVGWIRDLIRGARLSLTAADKVSGGRINRSVMRYLPPSVDWYAADFNLEQTLPKLLYGVEQVLSQLLAGKSYTLAEIQDGDTHVSVRIV